MLTIKIYIDHKNTFKSPSKTTPSKPDHQNQDGLNKRRFSVLQDGQKPIQKQHHQNQTNNSTTS